MTEGGTESALAAGACLLRRVAKGDEAAVESLYRTYGDPVLRFVYRRVNERFEDAEEVTLDTFVSAVQLAPTYRDACSVYAWLCSIAKLRIVDFLRRQGRGKRIPVDRLISLDGPAPKQVEESGLVDPLDEAELGRRDAARLVDTLMECLSEDEREALLLRYVEELSVRDTSAVMKRSEKSIEGLLVRAKRKLRNCRQVQSASTGEDHATRSP